MSNACACMGPQDGNPFCPCKMQSFASFGIHPEKLKIEAHRPIAYLRKTATMLANYEAHSIITIRERLLELSHEDLYRVLILQRGMIK